MMGNFSVLAAVLTVMSVVSLSLLSLLCLRCRRKSKIIQEETQIYNPQTFQREGSMFAVTRSKTVTRANQITSPTVETREEFAATAIDDQSDYENITDVQSLEHTYVAPLPISLYENEQTKGSTSDADQDPGVYANVSLTSIKDDEDDYENSQFLDQVVKEQEAGSSGDVLPCFETEEPDYVNENGQ